MLEGSILTVLLAAEALNPLLICRMGVATHLLWNICLSMSPIPDIH